MLDMSDFESWQQHIRLYCLGKDNGENIFKLIDEGPFKTGKFRETLAEGAEGALHLGPERDRVFADLTPKAKERFKADIRATNILLQGLPKDIYTPINHYTDTKDIWDNVKMLLEGSELTKYERESHLYDDFEHFCQNKGETIHEYYVMFTKLINDIRNINMTMPKMQLNLKFVNNMLPKWGRFVTAVKLNRELKTSNYDQLYAYLKQHEAHVTENKMMLERYNQHVIDPHAFVSNVSPPQYTTQSSSIPQSAYVPLVTHQPQFADNTQLDSGLTPTVLNGRVVVQNVQGRLNRGQGNYARGVVATGNGGVQNRVGNANPCQAKPIKCYNCNGIGHIARQCTHLKRPHNSEYFKDKMLLMQAQENRVVSDEEKLLFIIGGHTNTFDGDVDEALTMFIANLSSADPIYDDAGPSYDSDILSEVQDHDNYLDSGGEYHEVHEMQNDVQPNYVVDSNAEYTSDSNIILYEQYVKDNAVQVIQSNVSFVPNDALMMIINDMHEQAAQFVSIQEQNKVVNESLTVELARYKEQVELYEKGKEELLKKELQFVKMQLNSTINHNTLIKEEVTTLKKDFIEKENKYLEEFLDIKQLKEKVEDKLYKQDQSLQIVHMLCKPKPFYDEKKKVAIGYKNPLYLTKAKQVQPALYNGHELVKTKHAPAIVHDSEDTLEIAETTRMKMLEKSKSTLWVDSKIKIVPPDYSKENYLATFTPQRLLTLKHIFWSSDIVKMTLKPISAMTVYPPNTPARLVPRVLPTKSQVKINIYTLTQLFSDLDKTCKKRITPCGLTKGERGFEQTKECYLTEQCAKIERKNLLIEYENLIADCLSNELLYSVMNDVNIVSRFSDLHDAYTVGQSHCLELEAEISKLKHKIEKDDYSEMIKRFSNLEIDYLNLQLKYQNLKERFRNNKSQTSQDAPEFDSFFKINKMKAYLQGKDNAIRKLKETISQMNKRRSEADRSLDIKALDSQNIELTEHVTALQEQNKHFRAGNEKVKQHYKELYDSFKITRAKTIEKTTSLLTKNEKLKAQLKEKISQELLEYVIGTCPKDFTKRDKQAATTPLNRKKQVTFKEPCDTSNNNTQTHIEQQKVQKNNVHVILSTGVNSSTKASESKYRSNTNNNRILPAKSDNKKKVEAHPRNNKSNLYMPPVKNASSEVKKVWKAIGKLFANVGYQWKPTGRKFTLGELCPLTRSYRSSFVRFGNDHFGTIMGYGDYILKLHSENICYVRDVDGVELLKGSRGSNLYTISVEDMMKSSPICLLSKAYKNKSWLWHRRLNHSNLGTINDLA
ncbi:retrovirus-related pol polyprotein from transposon TNT 1-94 [Tanacetum coccineum]